MTKKAPVYCVRKGDGLYPEMAFDLRALEKYKQGARIRVQMSQPRSLPHHRKYWVMLANIIDAGCFDCTIDDLHTLIKLKIGKIKAIRISETKVEYIPDSIAFEAMDQGEFQEFFDRAVRYLSETTGVDPLLLGRKP